MTATPDIVDSSLLGVGIYSPAEAGKLTGVSSAKIRRWLRGHAIDDQSCKRLWRPQIELDEEFFLGFRDLTEVRVVAAFIEAGLSAQKVRRAIEIDQPTFIGPCGMLVHCYPFMQMDDAFGSWWFVAK